MKIKTKLIIGLVIFFASFNVKSAYAYVYGLEIPENIEYYEWCYFSSQCEVPEKYINLIMLNGVLIRLGLEPLYY